MHQGKVYLVGAGPAMPVSSRCAAPSSCVGPKSWFTIVW